MDEEIKYLEYFIIKDIHMGYISNYRLYGYIEYCNNQKFAEKWTDYNKALEQAKLVELDCFQIEKIYIKEE